MECYKLIMNVSPRQEEVMLFFTHEDGTISFQHKVNDILVYERTSTREEMRKYWKSLISSGFRRVK